MTHKRKKSKSRSKHQNQIGKNISDLLPSGKTDSGNKGDIVKVEHKTKECVEKDASKLLSSYQDAIVCRSIVELALLNILIGDNTCDNINNTKVSNTNKATFAAMSGSGAGNSAANAQSNTGGLSKLQDLGRSLFGFLTGGNNGQNGEENGGQSKKSINASKHRESLDSNSGTTGRQRPASQVGSLVGTPILVHRKPPLQKDKQMSNNKTTAAVAQEIDNPVATKRKKKKNSIDNSNSNEVENKQNGEKSANVNAAKTKPPPSGKKRNRSASNKRRRMKAKEKASGAAGGDNENEDNEKDEHQDDNKSPSPHMVDNVDSTTKKGSIVNGKGSVAMITHNDKYDNNSKEPTHCHNQQNNIINKKPDKECEEETVFHSARNSVIIDNKLTRQDSELSSDKNEKYYSQENLSVKCSDDATEWRDGEKGEGCIDSAQREDSSHSCAQSAEVSCNNNLVGKKLPEQCKDLADVVQQNKLRGQGEVEPGDIHKLNINPQFNITRDTVNIKSTDIIKESLTEHETSDVKLTDKKEERGEEGLCGLSCEETITKISTSVNINPPSSDLLPPVGDKTSPPNSSQPLTPDINAPPTSPANTGATPPPAPPPPPPGYLTESIRVLSSSSASSKSSCRTEKQSKNSVDTSLKEFCKPAHGKKVKKTREELLLEQIAGVDDSFASFLRTQLNIIPVSRDRDDKATENSSETNNTLEKRKARRRRGDSECSESSVRSETTIKTTVAASGQSTAAAAPQTITVSSLTVEEESKSGSSTPKQCQLENGAEISSPQNTKDYEIESTYSTIPPPSDNNVVENESENSANKTALNEKLESNLASSEEEKVQPSSEIDTSVDDNCNTSTSIGQQEDINTQEAQQDINMSASIDQNVLTEVSADTSIDNVDAANNNVSTDDNTKNTSEIICDTTTTNNYITIEQPTPNIETDKKQTIITDNTKCEEGYSSMGGTHSSLETTTTTSTSPTSDLQSTSSCTEDHSSEENHHSDACYTENAPKDGEIVSMLSKSDSGYSGTSPKAARKKDISIDEAMKLYNRRVLGADNSLIAPPTVPTVVPTPKRNRIESEGSDYSDYTDSDSEYSEINGKYFIYFYCIVGWLLIVELILALGSLYLHKFYLSRLWC